MFWQIMQGLLDQYTLTIRKVLMWCGWPTTSATMWRTESHYSEALEDSERRQLPTGRFNNVMYQLYSILVILVTLKLSSTDYWIFFLLGLCPHLCTVVVLLCSYRAATIPAERSAALNHGSSLQSTMLLVGPLGLHVSAVRFLCFFLNLFLLFFP